MRKSSLWAITVVISVVGLFLVRALLARLGVDFGQTLIAHVIVLFVVGPVVFAILTPFNNRLRDIRKARGRDIVAEELHESESGMITLTPHDTDRQ